LVECSIATGVLNLGLTEQRALAREKTFKRGATILLREAVDTEKLATTETASTESTPVTAPDIPKKYVTDQKETITELVNNYKFQFPAGPPPPIPPSYANLQGPSSKTTMSFSLNSRPTRAPKSTPRLRPSRSTTMRPPSTSSTRTAAPGSSASPVQGGLKV
jgi:hypothetical protein